MNDFTIEELQELIICLSCRFSRQLGYETKEHLEFTSTLGCKVQSMIDNYCEHSRLHTTRDSIYCEQCCKEM